MRQIELSCFRINFIRCSDKLVSLAEVDQVTAATFSGAGKATMPLVIFMWTLRLPVTNITGIQTNITIVAFVEARTFEVLWKDGNRTKGPRSLILS